MRRGVWVVAAFREQDGFENWQKPSFPDSGGFQVWSLGAMRKIGEKITGHPLPDAALSAIEERAKKEGRVVLRVKPTAFFSTMPLLQEKK